MHWAILEGLGGPILLDFELDCQTVGMLANTKETWKEHHSKLQMAVMKETMLVIC